MIVFLQSQFHNSIYVYQELSTIDNIEIIYGNLIDVENIEVIIASQKFIKSQLSKIKNLKSLKLIQLISSGYELLPALEISNQVIISNATGVYSIPISEYVLSFVLAHFKKTFDLYVRSQKYLWTKDINISELAGKKALIIGDGDISIYLNRAFESLGIITTTLYRTPKLRHGNGHFVYIKNINELEGEFHLLIISVPLNKDSRNLVNRKLLNKITADGLIINVSRVGIVEEAALNEMIDTKNISYVCDGYVFDKPEELTQFAYKNKIITPHLSWYSDKNIDRLLELVKSNLQAIMSGVEIMNKVFRDSN